MKLRDVYGSFYSPPPLCLSFSLQYMSGFGNEFSSEDPRCPGALPEGQVKHTRHTPATAALIFLLVLADFVKVDAPLHLINSIINN